MGILTFIKLFCGLSLFIYGIVLMSRSLEKTAGVKLEKVLQSMTGNLLSGIVLGTAQTV